MHIVATGLLATSAALGAALVATTWFMRNSRSPKTITVMGAGAGSGAAAGAGASHSGAAEHPELHGAAAASDKGPETQEAQDWAALYRRMAEEFESSDLNAKAIDPLKSWFHGLEDEHNTPWPRKYPELEPPLQYGSVRLLVVPLEESPVVLRIAAAVTADIMRLLPAGAKVFANARSNYHCTVFHTSQPSDPRPNPTRADGGLDDPAQPPHLRRLPTPAESARELQLIKDLVADTQVPTLRLERVVQASTGVLLLTWTEVGSGAVVSGLRHRLRDAFPGASTKQATIIHSSLLRIVSSTPLGRQAVAAISEACKSWTARLRGTRYSPRHLWFIREHEFSTISGEREVLALADPEHKEQVVHY
ncbi:hypothetical protein CHLRE_02g083850v5 [Chlamydomonas reinhardtii]|uniref:Uncharacterized protein n=1 Tax=Chlamydomonas reinhardtii TaxID=3055 RepID=A0A2K3E0R6_CHLRE|nr:uncharacterized protein CHLRE_02g083850v5 [Chlamydomonas reinhardtii]XP_042926927.1 uncharacterized protein CHLRE_02g083850v5 [Chlamydomonas reinhardtii]PNW86371.1 hypothetical protein CHLRE_02g083850v5 [Chlamydomonas reinhardtii]PNW86372.1 hypothetical protein CHLRE_02g083850v5 [Chlamydomonas reinhardtii]